MRSESNHKALNYRADIDGLRAIAILLVLFYHIFPNVVQGGFIGVDIFFVISGFLITGIIFNDLENKSFSFAMFFSRRIKRIFPALLIVIATSFWAGWFLLLPKEFMELGKHIAGGVGYVANFTLWSDSGYFDALPELKPLLHLWSLGIEEQFYLFWPLALFLTWKYRYNAKLIFLSALVLSFALNVTFVATKPDMVFYFPIFRFWELFIGATLCLFSNKNPQNPLLKLNANYLSLLGIALVLFATFNLDKFSTFPGWWALLPTVGAACIIAAGRDAWLNLNLLSNKVVVWVGLISYPLYLWHWPIYSFMHIRVGSLPYDVDKVAVLISSFILSWLSYKFVERPIRHHKDSKFIISGLLVMSLVIGAMGIGVYIWKGVPSRIHQSLNEEAIPVELQEMLNPDFGGYISKDWREHKCFLIKGEDAGHFENECLESGSKPLIFLWGDSHAAALYSGLKFLQTKRNFSIAQYTASACPPILNWDGNINKLCREINNHNITLIRKIKPEVVFLQAAWYWSEYDWKKVGETINELKRIGIKRIVLVGPVPNWKEKVPNVIISYYRNFNKLPPKYTTFDVDINEIVRVDHELEALSRAKKITYISIYQTLCNSDGCMLSVGGDIRNISSLDYGHLSIFAAEFVIESVANKIFGSSY